MEQVVITNHIDIKNSISLSLMINALKRYQNSSKMTFKGHISIIKMVTEVVNRNKVKIIKMGVKNNHNSLKLSYSK